MNHRNGITYETVRAGQAHAYEDSVYEYLLESRLPTADVKHFCLSELHKVNPANEKERYRHRGHCGFPFGLESFFTFTDLGEGRYRFEVTDPYCD